jgi:hypothetical protein
MMDLEPCYDFENLVDCASIMQNLPCSFVLREKEFNTHAAIVFDIDGSVDVGTEVPSDSEDPLFFSGSMCGTKCIILNGQNIPAFISSSGPSPAGNVSIVFTPNHEPFPIIGCNDTPISKVIFHLFDFKDRIGTSRKVIHSGQSWHVLGITELESGKWKVELHEIKKSDEPDNRKRITPRLSHVCCLSRADGSEFDGRVARQMLLDLRLFFTFSQGAFCPPAMPVGYDFNDKKVWALGAGPYSPGSSMSWFDQFHSEELARLFPGFMARLEDDRWRETLQTVIYWCARSNNSHGSGIDTGIILAQIAIERLAYEYSVGSEEKEEAYNKLIRASDKFRFLFSRLEISLEIPSNFTKIKELAVQEGFVDAPHFLTELRNSMVHPKNERRHLFTGLYPDAWRLGLWYLELSILKICGYEGTYANRLTDEHWAGQVEEVPWSKKRPDDVV